MSPAKGHAVSTIPVKWHISAGGGERGVVCLTPPMHSDLGDRSGEPEGVGPQSRFSAMNENELDGEEDEEGSLTQ